MWATKRGAIFIHFENSSQSCVTECDHYGVASERDVCTEVFADSFDDCWRNIPMNKLVRCDFEEETSTGRYKKRVEKNKGNEGYSCVGLSNKYPNLDELSGSRTSTTTPWSRFAGRAEMIISCAFVLRRHQSNR